MRINNNLSAINTNRQKGVSGSKVSKSIEKLSSGLKINRSADDAAGLAISEKMRAQIRGLDRASQNCQDGISLVRTAEGGLQSTHEKLQRMHELAVQSASDINENLFDRQALDAEYQALMDEVDATAWNTEFNGIKLLDGSIGGTTAGALSEIYFSVVASFGAASVSFFPGDLPAKVSSDPDHGAYRFTGSYSEPGKVEIVETTNIQGSPGTVVATGYYVPKPPYYSGETFTINFDNGAVVQFDFPYMPNGVEVVYGSDIVPSIVLDYLKGENENGDILHYDPNDPSAQSYYFGHFNIYGGGGLIIQSGPNNGDQYEIAINNMDATAIGIRPSDIASGGGASVSLQKVAGAINTISRQRAKLGAAENLLTFKISNLNITSENLSMSESRLRDLDMAKEMTELTKQNMLSQSGTSMLAQANAIPQGVLQLLG